MSLTQAHHASAAVNQHGINRALEIFFGARPHFLHYGSPPFVIANSAAVTLIDPISFPGTPGGIAWAVDFGLPTVDLFPADGPLSPPLVISANQLALHTDVNLTIGCVAGDGGQNGGGGMTPLSTSLDVTAIAHPVARFFSPGVGDLSFVVDQVLVNGVEPPSLDTVLNCFIRMTINALLSGVRLPFSIIDADFFKIILEEGPTITDNRIEIRGDVS
jgi:hypothetical protein